MCENYDLSIWEVPWKVVDISDPWHGGTSNHLRWEKECGGNSQLLGWVCKTLPTLNMIFLTFQNCGILDLSHFCMCKYDKYSSKKLYSTVHVCENYDLSIWEVPWKVVDISDPWHGGTSNHLRWEKECGGNSQLLGWVCKTLSTQNRIFLTFKNCDILDLPHFNICQYDKYSSKSYTVLYMSVEVMICQSDRSPERLLISQTPSIGGIKSPEVGEGMWRKLLQLLGYILQKASCSKQDIPNLPKLWHIGPSTCLYLSIWQI